MPGALPAFIHINLPLSPLQIMVPGLGDVLSLAQGVKLVSHRVDGRQALWLRACVLNQPPALHLSSESQGAWGRRDTRRA